MTETRIDDDFKLAVKEYIEITDEIATIQKSLKDRKQKTKQLSEFIVGYMKENEKEICNLGDSGLLMIKQKKTKVALKKETLEKLLGNVLDPSNVERSIEYIFKNQEVKESEYLHRSNHTI
jgi:hypothetical protein